MKVTIALKGTLRKLFDCYEDIVVEVPDNCTCDEALQAAGVNYKETRNFGFVSVNNKRVMIDSRLNDGDYLKAFSRVSGG
ncbi:MAG: MoaD/ThiS family protein [Lentihominibacter sp.]